MLEASLPEKAELFYQVAAEADLTLTLILALAPLPGGGQR